MPLEAGLCLIPGLHKIRLTKRNGKMNREDLKRIVPARLRRLVSGNRNHSTQDQASEAELWERSRQRWRSAEPVTHLTWGIEVSGSEFVARAKSYGAFDPKKSLLEVGPGYGRLLKSILDRGLAFKSYLGVDLSERNVDYLKTNFSSSAIDFIQGDIEQIELKHSFDVLFSSLTFKHLFPSFEKALANAARHLNCGALLFFDLLEGTGEAFELDAITYTRHYTKEEVSGILDRAGLNLIAWDKVRHTPEHARLLVVAKKLAPAA